MFSADIQKSTCNTVNKNSDMIALPLSGKTCQNWSNLSVEALKDVSDFLSEDDLKNTTECADPTYKDITWCYVNNPGDSLRELCFLYSKFIYLKKWTKAIKC